jgi:hypothetical protein
MRVYLTDSQIPELRELPPAARRLVVKRGLGILRSRARVFYWLPTLLCIVGGVSGALLAYLHHPPVVISGDLLTRSMLWFYSGVGIGACAAGFIGSLLQRWKLRPYLRNVVDDYVSDILRTA